jgi:hypothetical protein
VLSLGAALSACLIAGVTWGLTAGLTWAGQSATDRHTRRVELLGAAGGARCWHAAGRVTPHPAGGYEFTDAGTGRAVRVLPGSAALVVTEEGP